MPLLPLPTDDPPPGTAMAPTGSAIRWLSTLEVDDKEACTRPLLVRRMLCLSADEEGTAVRVVPVSLLLMVVSSPW